VADRLELAFRRAALDLIPRGSSVLVAVSGGGDSVALLHLLVRYSVGAPLTISVGHLDHALRRGSAEDRRFVERMAKRLELPFFSDRRPVTRLRAKDESPEEAARRVRRQFLVEAAEGSGASLVATGHTLDDQAETILLRLVRGAGPTALGGMAPSGPGPFVHPLLAFDRNRVRKLVLPLLAETLNPRTARHLVEAAGRLREDALHLDEVARRWLARNGRRRKGALSIPVAPLASAPAVLGRRVARLAIEKAGADPRRISARHVEAILALAGKPEGKALDLGGGITATRAANEIVLR
jgi:tRNA(Ile)-lysidine synthase